MPVLPRYPRFRKTDRGFTIGEFKDVYGVPCSIQASSSAMREAIWLGCDKAEKDHVTGLYVSPRMHIDRPLARRLAALLQRFADTGELPRPRGARKEKSDVK